MPPKTKIPLEKVTLNLFLGDKATLEAFFPAKGWSVAAREVIHNSCLRLRESDFQEVLTNSELTDVDVSFENIDIKS